MAPFPFNGTDPWTIWGLYVIGSLLTQLYIRHVGWDLNRVDRAELQERAFDKGFPIWLLPMVIAFLDAWVIVFWPSFWAYAAWYHLRQLYWNWIDKEVEK